MSDEKETGGSKSIRPQQLKMEVRSCEELKALLEVRIKARVQDVKLVKELEAALGDLIAYGVGSPGGDTTI